jgi:maltooligosyltrehalose trehalohydrolase
VSLQLAQLSQPVRRLPIGADVQPDGSTHFRVWAPRPRAVDLVVERNGVREVIALEKEGEGYYSATAADTGAGTRYWYRLDDRLFADPVSRHQPEGPFGPSEVVDPTTYQWRDEHWKGITLPGQVLYEMHVGTFTQVGTFASAAERLPALAATGITCIEVMPIAEFPGRFGWGYDGVFLYAPTRLYGSPDDFRAFVDRAHALGLGVILDVVYNHFGPAGCVHREYSETYFSQHANEWGDALNFDGPGAAAVREHFTVNAGYWISEFHLDGLRLDAVQAIRDSTGDHVVGAATRCAREAARGRSIIVVMEHEEQRTRFIRPGADGGCGIDAAWNDDFHHSAVVAITGRSEAYYSDHRGTPQEFISVAKYGYLFQGQRYAWQKQPRGTRTDGLGPHQFVNFIENHDQIANSGDGSRLHQRVEPALYRAMSALCLLLPGTPMLFQGQEFGASSRFLYFADHQGDLAAAVRKGRAEFVAQFPSLASAEAQQHLPPPDDPATFEQCKLRWDEYESHVSQRRLFTDLIALRRSDLAFRRQESGAVDGAVLAHGAFVLRYLGDDPSDERLLVVNFDCDLVADSFAEPLLAPPDGMRWINRWSTEAIAYGGFGAYEIVTDKGWRVPGRSATVLAPTERRDGRA